MYLIIEHASHTTIKVASKVASIPSSDIHAEYLWWKSTDELTNDIQNWTNETQLMIFASFSEKNLNVWVFLWVLQACFYWHDTHLVLLHIMDFLVINVHIVITIIANDSFLYTYLYIKRLTDFTVNYKMELFLIPQF